MRAMIPVPSRLVRYLDGVLDSDEAAVGDGGRDGGDLEGERVPALLLRAGRDGAPRQRGELGLAHARLAARREGLRLAEHGLGDDAPAREVGEGRVQQNEFA